MKYLVTEELGCVYQLAKNEIEWAPLYSNGIFDDTEFGLVEIDLVGDEIVTFRDEDITLLQVIAIIRQELSA
jgi:hypothetical protein